MTAHKDLTGTDLHEIKGASTATVGQVPVADGLGSAPFGLIGPSSLSPTGNPFGSSLLWVQETKSDGVQSAYSPLSSYLTMPLGTTQTNEIPGSTGGSQFITLPAGTYYFEGYWTYAANASDSKGRARLYDTTHGTVLLLGPTGSGVGQFVLPFSGRFTLASSSVLAIQAQMNHGNAFPQGAGGGNEVYTDLKFWKIA